MNQSAKKIFMVRPASFGYNPQTSQTNAFQQEVEDSIENIRTKALAEFDNAIKILRANGIEIHVFNDSPERAKPDAIFPNNWISIHADRTYILYPMQALNRREERAEDIISALTAEFGLSCKLDLSDFEKQEKFLEGTGSIIFDHLSRKAYAAISQRTDPDLFRQLCETINYEPIDFLAVDKKGALIYHTNVVLSIGSGYSLVCLDAIKNDSDKVLVKTKLSENGTTLIELTYEQINSFAGNMLEVTNNSGEKLLVMSSSAYSSLFDQQLEKIRAFARPVVVPVPTIERVGGGSIRCMMAEIF